MSDNKHKEILEELKTFPKPELEINVKNQMMFELENFENKHQKRKRWGMNMKKWFVGVITAAAIISLSVISYNTILGKDKNYDQSASQSTKKEHMEDTKVNQDNTNQPLDPIDLTLGDHQVGMEKLYFEIPMSKDKVFIDRRIEGDYTLVDIRDKKTNELLYRYGESIGNNKEKEVFQEVESKHTKLKIKVWVEIDSTKGMITKIMKSKVEYTKVPANLEARIIPYSRTDKFPVEEVTVLADLYLSWENETEVERVYEGYLFGVIK